MRRILFIWGQCRQHKKLSSNFFFKNKRKLCHVRYVHTYKESFGSFHLINEVKDMKSDVLRALKGSFSEKKLWTLIAGSILTIFKKEKLHRLWISSYNISTVGIEFFLKFIRNSFFSFITYPFLLIDFVEV
jgi:hypothetical protein